MAGIDSGVIVANETRSDGPWTAGFGCYGISLQNGRLLWTSHGSGLWGRFVRLLDYVPGFTNELRDTPEQVEDGKVYCRSGRVLDVTTGQLIEKTDPDSNCSDKAEPSIGFRFYNSGLERKHPHVEVEDGLFLRHGQEKAGWQRGTLDIVAESEGGDIRWEFLHVS